MHILILTESFPPETKSASTLFFELGESLVRGGHQVSVITRMPKYNVAEGVLIENIPKKQLLAGIKVHRCRIPPLLRTKPLLRALEHFFLAFRFFFTGLKIRKIDVILVYSPPLTLGITGYWLGRIKNRKVVVNIQDLYPQTVIDLGLLKQKSLIKAAKAIERFVYCKADFLTVHSEGNREYLTNCGAGKNKVMVMHNWVDTEMIKPGPKDNLFCGQYNLIRKFVVSFAGVMGFAQGLEVILGAAQILKCHPEIHFILVGDGVKKQELENFAFEQKLPNVLFIPTQPLRIYPQVLQASDVGLVTLNKDLATPVVPGKLLSIMAAGRPVVASLPLAGDTPKIIHGYNCGFCVEPGNPGALAAAIEKLYNNKSLCQQMGQNGRLAAEKFFSREACVTLYENIFKELING
jgi:glycosyltransferase involved in cell wall biosynthesis